MQPTYLSYDKGTILIRSDAKVPYSSWDDKYGRSGLRVFTIGRSLGSSTRASSLQSRTVSRTCLPIPT